MKKAIYTGIFCTILGLCINTPANASIISRNFLDQALTDYATTTALDLKANQSDLTDLSSKIGTLPTTITAEGFYGDYTLPDNIGEQLSIIFYGNNERVNYIPGLMELNQMILDLDTTGPANEIWDSLYNGLEKKFINGAWQEWRGLTEMDTNIKNNTAKIGTLPSGSLIGNSPAMDALFIYTQNTDTPVFPGSLSDLINQLYGNTEGEPGAITALLKGFNFEGFNDEYDGLVGIMPAMNLGLSAIQIAKTASATATAAKTAADANTAKIGTLPEGITVQRMYEGWTDSEGEFFPGLYILSKNDTLLRNAYKTDSPSLLIQGAEATTIDGVDYTGPIYPLWKLSEGIDKIGTLPKGSLLGISPAMDALFISTQGTDTPGFPVSLSDLINQLYGSTEGAGAITALLKGFNFEGFNDEYDGLVGVLPAMDLGLSANTAAKTAQETANRAKALAESNATAIGTLPDGYKTVGAALSAIKGIAEEAKAAALAAIPDPKTEGSNGKYVLTVDIVGDNATYRWEPIDRGNTTTTTE